MGHLIYDMGVARVTTANQASFPGGSSAKVPRRQRFKLKLKQPDDRWPIQEVSLYDIPMDSIRSPRPLNGRFGGVIVLDDSRDMVDAQQHHQFYAHESCGQCTPCREARSGCRNYRPHLTAVA